MRIQTEYRSFENRWTISSSYDFQAHQQSFQRRWCFSQSALLWFEVLPAISPVLPGLSLALPGAPRLVSGAPHYCEGRKECPSRVWYSPEIDTSKFTLHILSDTPGGFHWLRYILLMEINENGKRLGRETSESRSAAGESGIQLERMLRQRAGKLTQLYQTIDRMATMLEAHMARQETQ